MLANPTIRAAAAVCKLSETQVYARLRNSEFKTRYDKARRELLERNTAALQAHLGAAIETMGEICADAEVSAQTRLNAATAIINSSLKLTEQTDILTRLTALEESLGGEDHA